MPLVYQHIINEHEKLAVWKITESSSFFAEKTGLITNISHPHKMLQFMAGRYLLKLLAPNLDLHSLVISTSGKPMDSSGELHFSISHCKDFVAVCVCRKNAVGIDIQFPEKKLEILHPKFLSELDRKVLATMPVQNLTQLCFGWSVKESLFKWYGKGEVNFIKHLHIEQMRCVENEYHFFCRFSKEEEQYVMVKGFVIDNHVLTYTIT